METLLPRKPMAYRPLLHRSLLLYQASFTQVILLALLFSLTIFLPRIMLTLTQKIITGWPLLSLYQLWLVVINLVGLVFFVAILWRMHCVLRDYHEPLAEDLWMGVKKVVMVFLAVLLQAFIIFVFSFVLVFTQILLFEYKPFLMEGFNGIIIAFIFLLVEFFLLLYIMSLLWFIVPLIATENKSIFKALEKSIQLAWNHWWRVFSIQLTPWLLYLAVLLVFRYVFFIDIHIYFLNGVMPSIWAVLIQLIIFMLFIPWIAALSLVQMRDLELRNHATK